MTNGSKKRYGVIVDVDRCYGCGACMIACAVENNVPPPRLETTERTGITPMNVQTVSDGEGRLAFFPVMCQHCGHDTPCVTVCPQNAVDVDPKTGIVGQMPQRCLGCRYCMAACPYHARYFNWWDPRWPEGAERTLNPAVAPRMRGVVEKCNFCHARYQAAQSKAAAAGRRDIDPADYVPACVEACPTGAIQFGDVADASSPAGAATHDEHAFRLLATLGTDPSVWYRSERRWVREAAEKKHHG
jgi:molybdopterin-containing oxidoreductase family iron-sulfur binding subunit